MRHLFKNLCVIALVAAAYASADKVEVNHSGASLVLKEVALEKASGSTVLKGEVVNNTERDLDGATFEIRAYDREGNLLRGAEEKTIFRAGRLAPHATAQLNNGYGVWLQGIPRESIASIEVYDADDAGPFPAHAIPLADQALFFKEYSEIEE